MSPFRKVIISLLITTILFGVGTIAFHAELLDFLDVYIYQPRRISYFSEKTDRISSSFGSYFNQVNEAFAYFISQKSTASFMETNASDTDKTIRHSLVEDLFGSQNALEGIRLIENDGNRVHFSTYSADIKTVPSGDTDYKDYPMLNEIPFYIIEAGDSGIVADSMEKIMESVHLYLDGKKNRLVFSYPLYDGYTAHRGTFVFYLSVTGFVNYLSQNDVINIGEHGRIVGTSGIVFNVSNFEEGNMLSKVEDLWLMDRFGMQRLVDGDTPDSTYLLFSQNLSANNICIGLVCSSAELMLSRLTRIFLVINLFISVLLVVLLLLNIRRDPMVTINERVRKFQYTLLREYIDRRDSEDWKKLSEELAQRKIEVTDEFKKDLGSVGSRYSKEIDALIDDTWHFISTVASFDKANGVPVFAPGDSSSGTFTPSRFPSYVVENLSEASDDEDVEELEGVDEETERPVTDISVHADFAAEVEELEPVEDYDSAEVEELESIDDDASDLEEIAELEELEPVEGGMTEVSHEEFDFVDTQITIEEISFEEYLKINFVAHGLDEFAERERMETEENFHVEMIDFSLLDEWESTLGENAV